MSQTTAGRWVRLQDGERFVGDLWPGSDERQRRETLISTLRSGKVPMRARVAAKPRDADLSPALPELERLGALGTSTPVPGIEAFIEALLLQADPRTVNVDIAAGHIAISPFFIANDYKGLWAPFFPGWHKTAAGRFIDIEFDAIEFDRAAAHAYVVENLLPDGASPSEGSSRLRTEPRKPQSKKRSRPKRELAKQFLRKMYSGTFPPKDKLPDHLLFRKCNGPEWDGISRDTVSRAAEELR